jgi:hypothetical protein
LRLPVVGQQNLSGAWADGDAAGTLRIRCQHGTFQSEHLHVAGGTDDGTIATDSTVATTGYTKFQYGQEAKFVWIHVYANTALCAYNGSTPDQTALVGSAIEAQESIFLSDANNIRNFKCIDYTASSASVVTVTCYF